MTATRGRTQADAKTRQPREARDPRVQAGARTRTPRTAPRAAAPTPRAAAVTAGSGSGGSGGPGGSAPRAWRVGPSSRRTRIMIGVVLVALVLFAVRLVQVQVVQGPGLAEAASSSRMREYPIHAQRGDIVDADGAVLATSVMTYDIQVDQHQIPAFVYYAEDGKTVLGRGASAAAELMAPLLGVDAHELGAQLTGSNGGLIIARNVTPEVRNQLLDLGVNGLTSNLEEMRVYPAGVTAGSLVGWVKSDGEGAAGIEYRFDDLLGGTDGLRTGEIGVGGVMIPGAGQTVTPADNGDTVHLTIDSDLQQRSQEIIDAKVAETVSEWGAVVVIEVGTGRILSWAESGMVDPNDPSGYGRLNSLQSPYEPGSTGKILTVAAAMEEGLVTPTSEFEVPYTYTPPNSSQTFKDHTEHETERLTVTGILADSSNTGTIQIGQLMSDQTRVDYMDSFGWGAPTGVELAGETAGIALDPTKWDGRSRFTTMFGQHVQVNLLQNTNVIATLANGGVRTPLHLVDGTSDDDGRFTPSASGEEVRVVSPETASDMIRMLESVTSEDGATGNRAAIDGYRVAGKTGTAQVADGQGGVTATAASFVGVVPADAPRIAVGVILFKPQHGFFGGTIAAPVFHDVASFALQTLGIPPTGEKATLFPSYPGEEPPTVG
ncbi:cell division protein FtsI (penicillin-binding protein 3) [Salana multivorans]|uniref:Cell division protein FtsI (Penicillin-binding protein 3) n=1 Tax=Salana multivorans TaxID=120377 RepID=A0A3N2D2G5_9MICO|nr:penicillin-binding protein 2 [Salana multivorans]ROR93848.1 cell division protein FtsI (penicillin-binding protein 3) [Salana multivorans]